MLVALLNVDYLTLLVVDTMNSSIEEFSKKIKIIH
jgi:hypothetical protein